MLASAIEAVVAALYLTGGLAAVLPLVGRLMRVGDAAAGILMAGVIG